MPRSKAKPSEEELMQMVMHTSRAVWGRELVRDSLEKWLGNFRGEIFTKKRERYLALWLLSHFTFYSQDEVTHLCRTLYRDLRHWIVTNESPSSDVEQVITGFFKRSTFVPAEVVSGSSGFIAYLFRQANDLEISLFSFSNKNLGAKIKNVIIIDDVTLTSDDGGQMHLFLKKCKAEDPNRRYIVVSLISSKTSADSLEKTFQVPVIRAITLDDRDRCFSPEADMFAQFSNLATDCKKLAQHYGEKIGIVEPLGYKDGQYAFGFFYNTPDNTLPIFWGQINGWVPVMRRFHKNYGKKDYLKNERFV